MLKTDYGTYRNYKKFRAYIKNINLNPTVNSHLPAQTRSERNDIELFFHSLSATTTAGAILFATGLILLLFNKFINKTPVSDNLTDFISKNIIAIGFIAASSLLFMVSNYIKTTFSDKTWENEVLLPTLKIMNPNIVVNKIPKNIRRQFNNTKSIIQSANSDTRFKQDNEIWNYILPRYSFINKNRVIIFNDDFQLTEIETIEETRDNSKAAEENHSFEGFLVKRKLPYHYNGELVILSISQIYNIQRLFNRNLEPMEVEDMTFNNRYNIYSLKNPNANLSAIKFLNPIRLNNVFGDVSYLANNKGYDFWCNIYIKDDMLYAAFNTGTGSLFNALDTPNPEDVAKTYMFILREINDYLNKVIAGR